VGDLRVKWSDNTVPLGYHPVPVVSIRNGQGPVVLLIAGTHGDEFEGPAALMRLVTDLQHDDINGQIIVLPALNAPAVTASHRVSLETELLLRADYAIDLHSGGKASFFQPCTLATRSKDKTLYASNLALAEAFGLPLLWVLGGFNDDRSLNSAAVRQGVPMIATELGGGGGVNPEITNDTEAGLYRALRHAGVLAAKTTDDGPLPKADIQKVEIKSIDHSLYAEGEGVFDRKVAAGQRVRAGQVAGWLHYVSEPRRRSEIIKFNYDGYVLAHTERGYVKRGDMLV